ncbi:MAG: hypothetical protein IJL91_06820 [Bacteroidales bacterium]|nr:hypothetical protein [Bacteroidales bacterium]
MSETTTGICKYCHQVRVIEHADESLTQEDKDNTATSECDCEGATEARNLEYQIARGQAAIDRIAGKDKSVAVVLNAGLKTTAEGGIRSIQIKTGSGVKYQMSAKTNIVVKSTETFEEESDGEVIE